MFHLYLSTNLEKSILIEIIKDYFIEEYLMKINIGELYDDNESSDDEIIIEYSRYDCINVFVTSLWVYVHNKTIKDKFIFFDFLCFYSRNCHCKVLVSTFIDSYTYLMIDEEGLLYSVEIDGSNDEPCPKIFSKKIISKELAINLITQIL